MRAYVWTTNIYAPVCLVDAKSQQYTIRYLLLLLLFGYGGYNDYKMQQQQQEEEEEDDDDHTPTGEFI